jgi:acetolactate synthase-1/2/3 large subunit
MIVAEALAKLIKAYGAEYIFTLTGAPQEPLVAMHNREGVRVVLGRSERSVLAMADAMARLTGRPQFGMVQFGPGATYLPASLIDAWWAKSPLIGLSGTTSTVSRYRYEYQEAEQTPVVAPLTKWAGELPVANRVGDVFRTAVRQAVGGCPGPTYLGIPSDVLVKPIDGEVALYADDAFKKVAMQRPPAPASEIERAMALLARAERPVILAGGGVLISEAWDELTKLAETLSIPVVTSMAGKGAIADTHALSVGVCGRYSRKVANTVLTECDFVLAVGTQLASITTDVFTVPKPGTTIVHIDIDPAVLGRTYREAVSIAADAKAALSGFIEAARDLRPNRWAEWTRRVNGLVAAWRADWKRLAGETMVEKAINPRHAVLKIGEALGEDDILVADTGYMAAWTSTMVERTKPGRLGLRAAGSLGWAFPAAMGAKLALPDRRVICLTGDGGIGYHLADMETALRMNTPTVTVVMNNSSLAFEYHVQKWVVGEMCPEASEFRDTDYAAIARAFGAHGERVTAPEEIVPAIRRAADTGKPALVDLVVSREIPPPVSRYEKAGVREL